MAYLPCILEKSWDHRSSLRSQHTIFRSRRAKIHLSASFAWQKKTKSSWKPPSSTKCFLKKRHFDVCRYFRTLPFYVKSLDCFRSNSSGFFRTIFWNCCLFFSGFSHDGRVQPQIKLWGFLKFVTMKIHMSPENWQFQKENSIFQKIC